MRHLHWALFAAAGPLAIQPVLAQATAPAASGGDTAGDGASWLLILVVLLVIGAVAWYFLRGRFAASRSVGVSHDRVAGSAQQAKGSVKEGVGSLVGDAKLQATSPLSLRRLCGSVRKTCHASPGARVASYA